MNSIKSTINQFIKLETSSSIILFGATIAALILANSPIGEQFLSFWGNNISVSIPGFELSKPISKWISDGLMAIFFFLIGLEIKREIITGELTHFKKASLPIFAAIGGMVIPSLLFTLLNMGKPGSEGWGIPMAADIAFSLGILILLGKRIPSGLKIFLMTFAIIDDLGAVLIIAFFYSSNIVWMNIFIGLGIVGLLLLLSKLNFYSKYLFFAAGVIVWILFLKSGIHATISGVLMAFTIPLYRKTDTYTFYKEGKLILKKFSKEYDTKEEKSILSKKQLHAIDSLQSLTKETASPLQYNEHQLHGWVAYLIMPLFAFANAGVTLSFGTNTNLTLAANIALSLVIGNFTGILLFSWLAIKLKIAELPKNINYKGLMGVSLLGGLGFTMSLFINGLAYSSPALINSAKMGILFGSIIAGTLGYLVLRFASIKKS